MQYTITYSTGKNPSTVFSYMFEKEIEASEILAYSVLPDVGCANIADLSVFAIEKSRDAKKESSVGFASNHNKFTRDAIDIEWYTKKKKDFKEYDITWFSKSLGKTRQYLGLEQFAYSTNIRDTAIHNLELFSYTGRSTKSISVMANTNIFTYKYAEKSNIRDLNVRSERFDRTVFYEEGHVGVSDVYTKAFIKELYAGGVTPSKGTDNYCDNLSVSTSINKTFEDECSLHLGYIDGMLYIDNQGSLHKPDEKVTKKESDFWCGVPVFNLYKLGMEDFVYKHSSRGEYLSQSLVGKAFDENLREFELALNIKTRDLSIVKDNNDKQLAIDDIKVNNANGPMNLDVDDIKVNNANGPMNLDVDDIKVNISNGPMNLDVDDIKAKECASKSVSEHMLEVGVYEMSSSASNMTKELILDNKGEKIESVGQQGRGEVANLDSSGVLISKHDKEVQINETSLKLNKDSLAVGINNSLTQLSKVELKGLRDYYIVNAIKDISKLAVSKDALLAQRNHSGLMIDNLSSNTHSEGKQSFVGDAGSFAQKETSDVAVNDLDVSFNLTSNNVYFDPDVELLQKNKESAIRLEEIVWTTPMAKSTELENGSLGANDLSQRVSFDDYVVNVAKGEVTVSIDSSVAFSSRHKEMFLPTLNLSLTKREIDLLYQMSNSMLSRGFNKLSKNDDSLLLDGNQYELNDAYSTVTLKRHESLLSINSDSMKLRAGEKNVTKPIESTHAFKNDSAVSIDNHSISVNTNSNRIFMSNVNIVVSKDLQNIHIMYDPLSVTWREKSIHVDSSLSVQRLGSSGMLSDGTGVTRGLSSINVLNDVRVKNGGANAILNQDYTISKDGKFTAVNEMAWWIHPKEYEAYYQDKGSLRTHEIRVLHPQDDIDFYVEDFIPKIEILPGAIDELILPHMLFDYSLGKDQVILDNYAINKKFVEGFTDDNYVICSVPIEQPIKYYEDLCLRFINVDVELMWQVLETLYHHFRENIHYFAGADPVKALNAMIKRTHVELIERYSSPLYTTRLRQAERCLKLFVWYSEVGLMVHSHKKIVHDRRDGVLGLFNGVAASYSIEKRLTKVISDDEIFDNIGFNSDGENILSSTVGYDSTISFKHVPQNIDTLLKFKGYIILQGELTVTTSDNVYTFTEDFNDVAISLPPEDNAFTIRFKPYHVTSYVDLATFVIEDRYNMGYELKYIGKLSNPNYTIEYILNYMKMAGDALDDTHKALETTAQIGYTLEMFREYLSLHHDKKIKGVRMTNKQ